MVRSWMSHSFDKILGGDTAPKRCTKSYDLYLAKNESEGCQISFVTDEEERDLTLEISGEHEGVSVEAFIEHFVPARGVLYPDPLVPYNGSFDLSNETPTIIYLDFTAKTEAKTGKSVFTVSVKQPDGGILDTFKVNVTVWNFALPITPACTTTMAITSKDINVYHKPQSPEELERLIKAYYNELLRHRMSAFTLPYDILDSRADEYMSDPRVTAFACDLVTASYAHIEDDETLVKIGKKVSSNPDWARKAYAYPFDEPRSKEHLSELKEKSARLERLLPGIPRVSPFYVDIDVDEKTDQIDFMSEYLNIWCPKAKLFREVYSEEQAEKYPPFEQRMADFKKKGDRLWWYVCNYPLPPYFNVLTTNPGIEIRALFWQQYRYDVDGFLYWGTNRWFRIADVWHDVDTHHKDVHGDGILFFPGSTVGIDGPVVSIRLKILRDGIEDFDLFKLAEKVIGRDAIVEKILSATPSLVEVAASSNEFSAIRIAIGNAVEAAYK